MSLPSIELQRLGVIGFNHRQLPSEQRGQITFDDEWCTHLVSELRRAGLADAAAFVGTCNRNEIIVSAEHPAFALELLRAQLHELLSRSDQAGPHAEPYRFIGDDAARHVLKVASSLDSLVLGEREIAQQVRRSFDHARRQGWLDKPLNGLAHIAMETSRRVHQRTEIGGRGVGVFSLAEAVVRQETRDIPRPKVAVIGLGEIGLKTARVLCRDPRLDLVLASRRPRTAKELGETLSKLPYFTLDELPRLVREMDAIIFATGAPGTVLHAPDLAVARVGTERPLVLVDVGIPPQVAPACQEVPGVSVFNLDWFTTTGFGQEPRHREAISQAHEIIEDGVLRVAEWSRVRRYSGLFDSCAALAERFKEQELPQLFRDELSTLSAEQQRLVYGSIHKLFTSYTEGLFETLSRELNEHAERDDTRHRKQG